MSIDTLYGYLEPGLIASIKELDRLGVIDPDKILQELVENEYENIHELIRKLLELISNEAHANAPGVFFGQTRPDSAS